MDTPERVKRDLVIATLPFGITGVPLRSRHGLLVCRKPVVDFAANCAPRHDFSRIHTWR